MTTLEAACRLLDSLEAKQRASYKQAAATRRLWTEFGHLVREERRHRKIRLKDFARHLSVSTAMASYLENGGRQWSVNQAKQALRCLIRPPMWPDCPVGPRKNR